jgi:hypothetical protein
MKVVPSAGALAMADNLPTDASLIRQKSEECETLARILDRIRFAILLHGSPDWPGFGYFFSEEKGRWSVAPPPSSGPTPPAS